MLCCAVAGCRLTPFPTVCVSLCAPLQTLLLILPGVIHDTTLAPLAVFAGAAVVAELVCLFACLQTVAASRGASVWQQVSARPGGAPGVRVCACVGPTGVQTFPHSRPHQGALLIGPAPRWSAGCVLSAARAQTPHAFHPAHARSARSDQGPVGSWQCPRPHPHRPTRTHSYRAVTLRQLLLHVCAFGGSCGAAVVQLRCVSLPAWLADVHLSRLQHDVAVGAWTALALGASLPCSGMHCTPAACCLLMAN
jgi:hypothetical protein